LLICTEGRNRLRKQLQEQLLERLLEPLLERRLERRRKVPLENRQQQQPGKQQRRREKLAQLELQLLLEDIQLPLDVIKCAQLFVLQFDFNQQKFSQILQIKFLINSHYTVNACELLLQ
jgi:hypothetical protein